LAFLGKGDERVERRGQHLAASLQPVEFSGDRESRSA